MKIYVGSLPPKASARRLISYFRKLVTVLSFKRIKNKGRKSPGYAILEVPNRSQFDNLLSKIHQIDGHRMELKRYLTPQERLNEEARMLRKRIYVKNIPKKTAEDELKRAFSCFGEVESLTVINQERVPENYGFVTFADEGSALRSIEEGFINFKGFDLEIRGYRIKTNKFSKETQRERIIGHREFSLENQNFVARGYARKEMVQCRQDQPMDRLDEAPQINLLLRGYPKPPFLYHCRVPGKLDLSRIGKKESLLSRKHGSFNYRFNFTVWKKDPSIWERLKISC